MDRGAWWATVHGAAKSDRTEQLTLLLSVAMHLSIDLLLQIYKILINFISGHYKFPIKWIIKSILNFSMGN